MKRLFILTATVALAAFGAAGAAAAELEAGDDAPPFALPGSDGKTHSLTDYRGSDGRVGVVPQSVHRWLNGRMQVAA